MTNWTLARRSVAFYLRSHLGTLLGAAIATAVLTGALLVGDSVRGSLRDMALARIGKIDVALASGDRLFRTALADELQSKLSNARVASMNVSGSSPTNLPLHSAQTTYSSTTASLANSKLQSAKRSLFACRASRIYLATPRSRQRKMLRVRCVSRFVQLLAMTNSGGSGSRQAKCHR